MKVWKLCTEVDLNIVKYEIETNKTQFKKNKYNIP